MFYADKRFIYLMLIIVAIVSLMGMNRFQWLDLLLTLPGVLIAITFHEYAHAFAATKLGDDTPRLQDRLNLNPLSHIDPIGFALLLFVGFGWGKPVEINPRNFDRKYSEESGNAIVAFAGPLMNFILAIVFTLIYCAIFRFSGLFVISQTGMIILSIIQYTIMVNIGLGLFNLIPLPPLDGSKIIVRFLPYGAKQWLFDHEQVFYIIFLVIWITGIGGYIISPALEAISKGLLFLGMKIFGL